MTDGQICFKNEYCTNCPIRKRCGVRPLFYSDHEYSQWIAKTTSLTQSYALKLGIPETLLPPGILQAVNMMEKRKKRELEEHPTYSVE